jgi:hypothetical protein
MKEVAAASFKVLSRHLRTVTKEKDGKTSVSVVMSVKNNAVPEKRGSVTINKYAVGFGSKWTC